MTLSQSQHLISDLLLKWWSMDKCAKSRAPASVLESESTFFLHTPQEIYVHTEVWETLLRTLKLGCILVSPVRVWELQVPGRHLERFGLNGPRGGAWVSGAWKAPQGNPVLSQGGKAFALVALFVLEPTRGDDLSLTPADFFVSPNYYERHWGKTGKKNDYCLMS